jgi:hypothetical protein
MTTSSPLRWHETFPGVFEREIDEAEQFYTSMAATWSGTGQTYFAITACIGFSIPYSTQSTTTEFETRVEKAFRSAWMKLRHCHPTLAAPVEYDPATSKCKKVYKTPRCKHDVESWMEETFKVIKEVQSGPEFANQDPDVGRYATLYILSPVSPERQIKERTMQRHIVFRSRHDIIDGIGTLILFNRLFRYAAAALGSDSGELEVVFGDEYYNLSPPFKIAASLPHSPSTEQEAKLKTIKAENENARETAEVLGIPLNLTTSMPRRSQRTAIWLSLPETTALLGRLKYAGTKPTEAFHTGIALAIRDLQERGEELREARYISYSLINLRRSCMPPYHSPLHAASVYHSVSANSLVVDLTIPSNCSHSTITSSDEFAFALKQVKDFYQNVKIDADYLSIVPSLFSAVTPPYPEKVCKVPPPNSTPSASLSSMGLVDRIVSPEHGPFRLDDPWVIGAEYSTGLGLFLGTWRGRMCLSAVHNEAFHGEKDVLKFLESVKTIVMGGLGLNVRVGS